GLKLRLTQLPLTTAWIIPILILAVPIFDNTLVVVSRCRRGLLPFASPRKDHTAHRLANLPLGPRGAVVALYATVVLFGIVALTISRSSLQWPLVLGTGLVLNAVAAVVVFEKLPYQRQELRDSSNTLA